jgi:hypothetical protein
MSFRRVAGWEEPPYSGQTDTLMARLLKIVGDVGFKAGILEDFRRSYKLQSFPLDCKLQNPVLY